MRRAEILEGFACRSFGDVLSRWEAKQISQLEAAELMGVSDRTFRRWTRRFEEEGEAGLVDRRLGKPSPRRVPAAEAERVTELYRTRYGGFTAKHQGHFGSVLARTTIRCRHMVAIEFDTCRSGRIGRCRRSNQLRSRRDTV